MTRLYITETCEYEIDIDGTVYEAMREFLRMPNTYLTGVTERHVAVANRTDADGRLIPWTDEDDQAHENEVMQAENDS